MLPIASARTTRKSRCIEPLASEAGEDNVAWLERATKKITADFLEEKAQGDLIRLALVGGTNPVAFRLRVAQAHSRHDLTPSNWSHVILFDGKAFTAIYEISLEPRGGFLYPVPTNGLQRGTIETYRDRRLYPNIALIGIRTGEKLTWEKIERTLTQFQKQRSVLDAMELIVRWLAFVWGAGRAGNPLLEGFGIPSAAMLEVVFSALGYDLTPGLESRSSCPEAIWQAVKWWHEYYDPRGTRAPRCLYRTDHRLVPELESDASHGPARGDESAAAEAHEAAAARPSKRARTKPPRGSAAKTSRSRRSRR